MSELPEQEAVTQGESPLDAQDDDDDDDKGHTFRKRRLSLTNLRELDQADGDNQKSDKNDSPTKQQKDDDANNRTNGLNHHDPKTNSTNGENGDASPFAAAEGDEKAHSFRKRRLSLTHKREDSTDNEDNGSSSIKRMRRNSEASAATNDSGGNNNAYNLKSRTSHAAELLAQPPPSPASTSTLPKLYQQAAPPQQLPILETLGDDPNAAQPKWKKRHTRHKDEKSLPFPRDIVGTFSCHGVEPIYDEDYQYGNVEEDFEEDEDEDDNGWIVGNADLGGKKDVAERPTMAAKINQDRGGVAFPYGNCPKTALFAVYDGT
jgi:hypothetical protein